MMTLPLSRIPDPLEAPVIRWGVLAPGGIAHKWTAALHARTTSRVVAAGSRSLERAQAFATEFGAARAYGSYESLVDDPEVDAVYIASPHSHHHELEEELLGEVRAVGADHGQLLYPDGPQRLADPALAGGALLDLGIYPVSFAHLAVGPFANVQATGTLAETGVDVSETIAVTGPQGAIGTLSSTMLAKTPCSASISGTRARLEIDGRFYQPNVVRLLDPDDREIDRYEPPSRIHGLAYEAAEFARLLTAGKTESDLLPMDETVRIMHVLDEVRSQLGVRFQGED